MTTHFPTHVTAQWKELAMSSLSIVTPAASDDDAFISSRSSWVFPHEMAGKVNEDQRLRYIERAESCR